MSIIQGYITYSYLYSGRYVPPYLEGENAVDMFPQTDGSKDINAVLSSHVECVVRLDRVKK